MTALDQLVNSGGSPKPLRPTTMPTGGSDDSDYQLAMQRLREQESFMRDVGPKGGVKAYGRNMIMDTTEADRRYEEDKLQWIKKMLRGRLVGGFPMGK